MLQPTFLNIITALLTIWNLFVFTLYGVDKFKAARQKRRIRELTLLLPPFLFASPGALLGMVVFNHKTSKPKFRLLIPLSFLVNLTSALLLRSLTS